MVRHGQQARRRDRVRGQARVTRLIPLGGFPG